MGFKVYIDESGDEGFKFREDRCGSSEWFVLSAVVTRAELDLETVKLVDRVREMLGRKPKTDLHFRNLKHQQRLPYVNAIGAARLRSVSVLCYKPALAADTYSAKGLLYNYATRLLLERVSWLCRDSRRDPSHRAQLIFSNRSNMSYADLLAYLKKLRANSDAWDVRIDWTAIDCDDVRIEAHNKLMGLQIADAVASAMLYGVRQDAHGFTEPRYVNEMHRTVYERDGRRLGYGVKLFPPEAAQKKTPIKGAEWLFDGRW